MYSNFALRRMLPSRARGAHVDRAFARVEGGVGKIAAALVDEGAFLGHAGQIFKMALMERRVDHEARAVPPKPLLSVAYSTLCQVEKLSSWVQPIQEVVIGQVSPRP